MRSLICFVAISGYLLGQQTLTFEVASVRLRPPNSKIQMIGGAPSGTKLTLEAMSLSNLISWAYNVKLWQVVGGPAWAGVEKDRTVLNDSTKRFDIVAKAEGNLQPSLEEFRQMLQSLLADRFHLKMHQESRDSAVYALVVDKNGPKFQVSSPEAKGILRMSSRNGSAKVTASGGTMTQLVNWFSNANGVDRPVIDQTGLPGQYDFELEWASSLTAESSGSNAPSIFTAMPKQLGLRLEPRRAPVSIWVIDRAEIPAEN